MNPLEENWFLDQNNKILDEYTVSKEKQHNQSQTLSGAKPQVNDANFTTDRFQLQEVSRLCKPSGQSAAADCAL